MTMERRPSSDIGAASTARTSLESYAARSPRPVSSPGTSTISSFADEPPVPVPGHTPPQEDPEAIGPPWSDPISIVATTSSRSCACSSDPTSSGRGDVRYKKVKGPAEFLVSVLRMTGEFDRPRREMIPRYRQSVWMGTGAQQSAECGGLASGYRVDWTQAPL